MSVTGQMRPDNILDILQYQLRKLLLPVLIAFFILNQNLLIFLELITHLQLDSPSCRKLGELVVQLFL
jgi:hypothetical protein